jgi:hypothetical protein
LISVLPAMQPPPLPLPLLLPPLRRRSLLKLSVKKAVRRRRAFEKNVVRRRRS